MTGLSALRDLVRSMSADDLAVAIRDLGGHDLGLLTETGSMRCWTIRCSSSRSCRSSIPGWVWAPTWGALRSR
jgi:hypothetical protein